MAAPDKQTAPDYEFSPGFDEEDLKPPPLRWPSRRKIAAVLAVLLFMFLLVFVPPLVNVSRYRRQIQSSISLSLGRPVRIDAVALTMLPTPGFTLQTFIVEEDPAFGSEPVLRADSVRVSIRASSLWRRHVEFSKIVLTDPSVNLVRLPDGRWNLQSILLQAARMPAAPTAQKTAGQAPRFPYIEATGARVNLKMGADKLPISLTDARFSLWLPQPEQWHLRLEAHPNRTDGPPMDSGLLRVEGTLGKAATLADVPLDLAARWSGAPLGAVSGLMLGRDAGIRGELTVEAAARGTAGRASTETTLHVDRLRRADWVPEHPLDLDLHCTAQAGALFHQFTSVNCAFPPASDGSKNPAGVAFGGTVPNVMQPRTITAQAVVRAVPAATLLDALRVASQRTSPDLAAAGLLAGTVRVADAAAQGQLAAPDLKLTLGNTPLLNTAVEATLAGQSLAVAPFPVLLGAAGPAMFSINLHPQGYELHLSGPVLRSRLLQFAQALPVCGDGLEAALPPAAAPDSGPEPPLRIDLASTRTWGSPQVWTAALPAAKPRRHAARRKK